MDNISLEKYGAELPCEVQLRTEIGGRQDQQDTAYIYCDQDITFAIVCDGMGGTEDGAQASSIAVNSMRELLKQYIEHHSRGNIVRFLAESMTELDSRVSHALGKKKGGTTAVAVMIQDGKLYWFSAGDSRLYICRGSELVQATRDHNYFLRLDELLKNGEISQEDYRRESEKGEALISYMGVGGLPVYDLTNVPLNVMEGDILLLTTDGLYKAIPQELILHILRGNDSLAAKADKLMSQITVLKSSVVLDNTTYALIEINTRGVMDE